MQLSLFLLFLLFPFLVESYINYKCRRFIFERPKYTSVYTIQSYAQPRYRPNILLYSPSSYRPSNLPFDSSYSLLSSYYTQHLPDGKPSKYSNVYKHYYSQQSYASHYASYSSYHNIFRRKYFNRASPYRYF